MNRLFPILLALALALSCESESQHAPHVYGTVTVFVSAEWLPVDRPRIRDTLTLLDRTGPDFVETPFASTADVILRPWTSPNCETSLAGRHFLDTRVAEVDPACTPGDTAFRAVAAHEILHVLGLRHVCRREGDLGVCSPVGYGRAVMNPYFGESDADPLDPIAFYDVPTELDLAEMRRVRRTDARP